MRKSIQPLNPNLRRRRSGFRLKRKNKPRFHLICLQPLTNRKVTTTKSRTRQRPEPPKPPRKMNTPLTERKDAVSSLNDLNELPPRLEAAKDYMNACCTPEADEYFAKLTLELEKEERDVLMSGGRGRGSHQIRNYLSRPQCRSKKKFSIATGCPRF